MGSLMHPCTFNNRSILTQSDRIFLRALEPEDAMLIFQWENDVHVWKHGDTLAPFGLHEIKNYIASVKDIYADRQYRFIIASKENSEALGMIDLFEFDPKHLRSAVGVYIAQNKRNEHYGRDSIELLEDYCRDQLNLHQLHCSVRSDNERSIHLFESCGFEVYGRRKQWFKNENQWEDQLLFQKILSK